MKVVRRSQGAILIVIAALLVHIAFGLSHFSLEHGLLPTAASVAALILSFGLLGWVTVRKDRMKTETLEFGRRGLMISEPDHPPFALAWKMIREAEFEPSAPQYWRFIKKTEGVVILREESCSPAQWKQLSDELHRKFKARKIPVTVLLTRRSDPVADGGSSKTF